MPTSVTDSDPPVVESPSGPARPRLALPFAKWLHWLHPSEETMFIVLSILIGGLASLVIAGYHSLIEWIFSMTAGKYVETVHNWHLLIFPVIGSLLAGIVLMRVRNARGSGLNQVKIAIIARDGYISTTGTIAKFFTSAVSIGMGMPLGPEDPAVHIGGGLASVLGRLISLPKKRLQQLVTVGAAAGLAGAFNTPVTAVIFTLEEVVGDINAPVLGSTIIATVTAVIVRRALLGKGPIFHVPPYELTGVSELGLYALLGVCGGLISALFAYAIPRLRSSLSRVKRSRWIDSVALMGAAVAGIVIFIDPKAAGVGYRWVDDALNGRMLLSAVLLLLVCKLIGTGAAFATGNSGGLFAQVLFIGSMLGASVGFLARYLLPHVITNIGAFALVGMGVTFAGIIRAPMTSVFMIFEVTQDYQIMLPVMLASTIAYVVARAFRTESMFEVLAEQDGIYLPARNDQQLRELDVRQAMRTPAGVLPANSMVGEAVQSPFFQNERALMVLDGERLVGAVTKAMLQKLSTSGGGNKILAEIITPVSGYRVFPDQSLSFALSRLGAGAFVLPVVSRIDSHQLLGVLTADDALKAYGLAQGEEVRKKEVAEEIREM